MRKVLSLLLVTSAISLQAQTMLVNDFESGLNGAYVAWGGSCEVIDNPNVNASNNSSKVMKIVSDDFAPVGFPVTIPAGKSLLDYTGIRFQAAILEEVSGHSIHWIGFNVGVSEDLSSMELIDPTAGNGAAWGDGVILKWVDVELLFNEVTLAEKVAGFTSDSYNVMIKLGREKFIYAVDNIRLIEKEVTTDPNMIFSFETMDLGPSNRCAMPWAGSCEIVSNPYKSDMNNTEKCLKVVNPECSPVTLSNALPDRKSWKDYKGIKFQICMTAGEGIAWGGIELGVRKDNGEHIKIGAAYDEEGNETAAWGDCTIGSWMDIELSIKEALITEEIKNTSMLYLRLMKNNMEYLVDNIILVPSTMSSIYENTAMAELTAKGSKGQLNLSLTKDDLINVYSIEGKSILSRKMTAGEHVISLPAGLYIVNKNKVIVY